MNWQERAEKAEAELARLREQEPVAYVKYKTTGGNVGLSWLAIPTGEFYPKEGEQLYAAPVPAVAAPNETGLGKGEFVIWPVKINGVHGLAFVKTDDPKVVGTSHAEPEDGQIELGAGDSAIYFGNAESAMVLAERLQYVISLMTGSDAAPVPAVAAPAVPEEWRKVMVELADDLAIEIDENYPPERRVYPSEQRRYEGEMEIVNRARALLQPAPQAPTVPDAKTAGIIKRLHEAEK